MKSNENKPTNKKKCILSKEEYKNEKYKKNTQNKCKNTQQNKYSISLNFADDNKKNERINVFLWMLSLKPTVH